MAASSFHRLLHHHNRIIRNTIIFFFFFFLFFTVHGFTPGSSLSVGNNHDVLVSPNGLFTAGFYQVGPNAYCFAVWFSDHLTTDDEVSRTVVWMANRDTPMNGKHSKLYLFEDGNLVLTDADQYIIWSTQTKSTSSSLQLQLHDTGNLVLYEREQDQPLWQSFDFPTDTLLPGQILTKNTQLVSSRSSTNHSSGYYKLFFDIDSILRLHYDGPETASIFWPDPGLLTWEAGRYQYINSRRASLDANGRFNSSDGFGFLSADFGIRRQRMMKIDIDGNVRVYSLVAHRTRRNWEVQWQALSHSCKVHGVCGPNSLCTYSQDSGRRCSCLHGYKMVKSDDWGYGCEPEFEGCKPDDEFIELRYVEFYGYDAQYHPNYTLDACKKDCLQDCNCKGFQLGYDDDQGTYYCYLKSALYNGYQLGFYNSMYIKLPKTFVSSFDQETTKPGFRCAGHMVITPLIRSYRIKHGDKLLGFLVILGCVIGFIEIVIILLFWYKGRNRSVSPDQIYFDLAAYAFRKFTYRELKKATCNFHEEIGRGGGSVVYKGRLSDNRIAAIKKLENINHQGEAEFQAEISTIGRLNHKNLIETWGYCAEGKHRLVVYEFMKNGSLAENLRLGTLDWETRFEIAKGTAEGLAYLHEECLEWVLHCDVKPHNILLDDNYTPKVADFGLSKLFDRGGIDNKSKFSTIRGTRGYMAPEWVLNLPITSKVDVFSYGVVILEMITGRSPVGKVQRSDKNWKSDPAVIEWVRDRIRDDGLGSQTGSCVEEIVDGSMGEEYDRATMMNMVRVALQCVEEDMEVRPTMSQVVNMLLHPVYD